MDAAIVERLLDINRLFYAEHASAFSETRQRLQPGAQKLIQTLGGAETILDFGCGNGQLARALSQRGHHGHYLGVDQNPLLLAAAEPGPYTFDVQFLQIDLTQLSGDAFARAPEGWDVAAAFAVLHHIPSADLRGNFLRTVRAVLAPDGRLMLSNWQFAGKPRFEGHMVEWSAAGIEPAQVDAGDYLLDWRRGGPGLRYVHQFGGQELAELAAAAGFVVSDSFRSDGADRRSALYQVWKHA